MKRKIFLLFYYQYLSSCKSCHYIKTLFNLIRVMCMNMKNNWRSNSETFQYSFLLYIYLYAVKKRKEGDRSQKGTNNPCRNHYFKESGILQLVQVLMQKLTTCSSHQHPATKPDWLKSRTNRRTKSRRYIPYYTGIFFGILVHRYGMLLASMYRYSL